MAETAKKKGHIVMIPFMAHGHLIPFLALARKIQETTTSFTITIATTPFNIQHLKSAISTTISSINLAELSFNHSQHGLPPNIENTEKLPLTDVIKLFHASTSLEAPLSSLISKIAEQEGQPPVCIISDVFLGWVTNVAKSLGFPINYKFHKSQMHKYLREADGTDSWSKFFPTQITLSMKSDGWICNTVEEIETFGLQLLRNYLRLPV
ncbi:hypothetical protein TSUD_250830 [Trifolium subterraneum]|uniref:Glycosyltransferase N-terminal domain-containing protein n=1 Tax=Trifolium subterraneum TaxID=3900 RepID=A0A2Z6MEK8_TRISU|nr:hypothetical protein TSUD_250830 [Trifolium subterraneum]